MFQWGLPRDAVKWYLCSPKTQGICLGVCLLAIDSGVFGHVEMVADVVRRVR